MPAASATCPLGKSWAVITVMGSPFLCIDLRVPIVTFFLALVGGEPIGEWELHLVCWAAERKGLRASCDGGVVLRVLDREAHDRVSDLRYMGTLVLCVLQGSEAIQNAKKVVEIEFWRDANCLHLQGKRRRNIWDLWPWRFFSALIHLVMMVFAAYN
jgi:hypothetical protein